MATFKVLGREFETRPLRGREGRATMNYIMKKISSGQSEIVFDLTEDNMFLTKHLPIIVDSKEDAKYIDENATTQELLILINRLAEEVGRGFETEEMKAALKNSNTPQAEED